MVRSIRNAEETTPERNVAVKSFQTEYQLSKVAVTVSIGLQNIFLMKALPLLSTGLTGTFTQ
jgi:hypothetical protein